MTDTSETGESSSNNSGGGAGEAVTITLTGRQAEWLWAILEAEAAVTWDEETGEDVTDYGSVARAVAAEVRDMLPGPR